MIGNLDIPIAVGDDVPRTRPSLLVEVVLLLRGTVKCPDYELYALVGGLCRKLGEEPEETDTAFRIRHRHAPPRRKGIPYMPKL